MAIFKLSNKNYLLVANIPASVTIDDPAGTYVDLSAMYLRLWGGYRETFSITLTTDSGTFEAAGSNQVDVTGSGTSSITFTGQAKHIDRLLDNTAGLLFVADPSGSNSDTAAFDFTATFGDYAVNIGSSDVTLPQVSNDLTGTTGNDVLTGDGGSQTILGLAGNDVLVGAGGDDKIDGGAGNDVVQGGAGADVLEGGSGEDTLRYFGSPSGVKVSLDIDGTGTQAATGGDADNDTISGFENVYSTEFNDVLIGNAEDNVLFGYGGNDILDGGAGDDVLRGGADADTLTGGAGEDWLRYLGSTSGVNVNLTLDANGFHQTSGGDADGDVASGFENIYGSDFGDFLTGDAAVNYLIGFAGADTIDGGDGNDIIEGGLGADILIGGDGTDILQYDGSDFGVTVDLNLAVTGTAQVSAGDASGDVISGFENVSGSDHGDTLIGDGERNFLMGLDGDDTIDGGDGYDVIRGGSGADTLIGGAGSDVVQYAGSTSGVTVNLTADSNGLQQASGGDAQGDIISEFEHVYATNHDDVLTGNASRNILYGYSGDDTIDGGAGNDVLRGSGGADAFVFSTELGEGNVDRITDFSSADDTVRLDADVFTGLALGVLDAFQFVANATGIAQTASQRIVYDSATGDLHFDSDGSGAAESVQFASLTAGLSLDETDFFVF